MNIADSDISLYTPFECQVKCTSNLESALSVTVHRITVDCSSNYSAAEVKQERKKTDEEYLVSYCLILSIDMYSDSQLRDISEVSEVGVTIIQQFRHLGPFTHPLSSSPSVDHGLFKDCLESDHHITSQILSILIDFIQDRAFFVPLFRFFFYKSLNTLLWNWKRY